MKEEVLEPIWPELDALSGLLSDVRDVGVIGADVMGTDAQEHGVMPETEGYELLKESEFAQQGYLGPAHGESDAQATFLDGEHNLNDNARSKNMPESNNNAPYELALLENDGNFGLNVDNLPFKENLSRESQDNSSAGLGDRGEEPSILQSVTTEKIMSYEENLLPVFAGVDSKNGELEKKVEVEELDDTQVLQEGEFAQQGRLGPANGESDAQATFLDGEHNSNDNARSKNMPESNNDAPYELALLENEGNFGLNVDNLPFKENLSRESQDNSSAGLGDLGEEPSILQSVTTEKIMSYEEKLLPVFAGVDSVNGELEKKVEVEELDDTQVLKESEFAQEGDFGPLHGESDAQATGVQNSNDNARIKDMPESNNDSPYELALLANEGNFGLNTDNHSFKKNLPCELQDNSSAGLGDLGEEPSILQSMATEKIISYEEKLLPVLAGVDTVNGALKKKVEVEELEDTQLPVKENENVSQGVGQEQLHAIKNAEMMTIFANKEKATGYNGSGEIEDTSGGGPDGVDQEVLGAGNFEPKNDDKEESDVEDSEVDDEEIISVGARTPADLREASKLGPSFVSEMLRDGSLSAEGLASKGFLVISDSSESEEDSDDTPDDEDEESDTASSSTDSGEEEDAKETKSKAKTPRKEDSEETGPPRTKHELEVLPPVLKVTAVLEPHHKAQSVGCVFSVLDLKVVVESSGTERVLNEDSILWLTESRVPLGIVDEVFGPVEKPFYLIRFNDVSEIPEEATAGADVSYVSEFSQFVLKDSPSLYKKAVDASGLDDEELLSDEEAEFSDDEKEAAAKMREKSKRQSDNWEPRQGQDRKSADGHHSKGQKTERGRGGRGRGRGRGRGPTTANVVDSAGRPGNGEESGRWNRGRPDSPRGSSHQEFQTRGSRAGRADGLLRSPQHQQSSQRREGLYVPEQAGSQMLAHQAGGMHYVPFNPGALAAHMRRQEISVHQPTAGFPRDFEYPQVPRYDVQLGRPGQGSFYPVPGGSQFVQNPLAFGNPNFALNPYFNIQGHGQMNIIHQDYGNLVHTGDLNGQMNLGVPIHHGMGDPQPLVHPSLDTFLGPSPVLTAGLLSQDHNAPSMSQNSHYQDPVGTNRTRSNDHRGHSAGRQQRGYHKSKGFRR